MSVACGACKQVMDPGVGCTFKHVHVANGIDDDYSIDRIPYSNAEFGCHDCNVTDGQFHHPNCDMERCPICGGQLISCDCPIAAWVE